MAGRHTEVQFAYVLLQILKESQLKQVKMSTDLEHYAPLITQNLDFATMGVYLLKHGVVSVIQYDHFCKALQSGSSTNGEVMHQVMPRILRKARKFYRALRDYVNDKNQDAHPSNNELFDQLPKNFVSV